MSVSDGVVADLRTLIYANVKGVVDKPEEVFVNIIEGNHSLIVELETASSDVGYVVGRGGVIISSIRTILDAFGGRNSTNVSLDFISDKRGLNRSRGERGSAY